MSPRGSWGGGLLSEWSGRGADRRNQSRKRILGSGNAFKEGVLHTRGTVQRDTVISKVPGVHERAPGLPLPSSGLFLPGYRGNGHRTPGPREPAIRLITGFPSWGNGPRFPRSSDQKALTSFSSVNHTHWVRDLASPSKPIQNLSWPHCFAITSLI